MTTRRNTSQPLNREEGEEGVPEEDMSPEAQGRDTLLSREEDQRERGQVHRGKAEKNETRAKMISYDLARIASLAYSFFGEFLPSRGESTHK
jgi:hypothetical protein